MRDRFPTARPAEVFVRYYERLSDLGLAPNIVAISDSEIWTERHTTLREWLGRSQSARAQMARKLVVRIEEMHSHGICHRDLHVDNVVLCDGMPLFIDPAFATDSEPTSPCCDLVGPGPSGVSVAPEHACQPNDNRHGVWWDSTGPVSTLGEEFGTLTEGPARELELAAPARIGGRGASFRPPISYPINMD
jgi:serine/threonine protein kinase